MGSKSRNAGSDVPANPVKSFADLEKTLAPIEWYWSGWLPRGFLTLVAGRTGIGKSALLLHLGTCVIKGSTWPDGTPNSQSGSVVWAETEASQALNLRRAKALDLDLTKLILPLPNALDEVNLNSAEHRAALRTAATRPGVRAMIIDSLSGGNTKDENSPSMIHVVKFLAEIARDANISVIISHHIRKAGPLESPEVTLDRVRGSSAILQPARVVIALDELEVDASIQRIRVIKSNLGEAPDPLGYFVDGDGVTFVEPPVGKPRMGKGERALEFLKQQLAEGSKPAADIYAAAKKQGIGNRTLEAAKSTLKVQSKRIGGRHGAFQWSM